MDSPDIKHMERRAKALAIALYDLREERTNLKAYMKEHPTDWSALDNLKFVVDKLVERLQEVGELSAALREVGTQEALSILVLLAPHTVEDDFRS